MSAAAKTVWDDEKWRNMLGFQGNPADTGNGYTAEQVAAFHIPSLEKLLQYQQAVRSRTVEFLKNSNDQDLWKTIEIPNRGQMAIAELMVLYLAEINHHIGQIDYLRGLILSLRQ